MSNVPPYAVDDAAVIERARTAKAAAEWCAANDAEGRLRHITTANTARDLDAIRAALGEKKASFFGASYGSALGAAYASMFADTTDRVVIDSNLGDTHLDYAAQRRFGLGVEQTFPEFAAWAAARHGAYGLGRTPAQVRKTYFRLAERLDETPVGYVNGAAFRFTTFAALYGKVNYPALAQDWQSLLRGDNRVGRRDPAGGVALGQLLVGVPRRDLQRRQLARGRQHLPAPGRQGPREIPDVRRGQRQHHPLRVLGARAVRAAGADQRQGATQRTDRAEPSRPGHAAPRW